MNSGAALAGACAVAEESAESSMDGVSIRASSRKPPLSFTGRAGGCVVAPGIENPSALSSRPVKALKSASAAKGDRSGVGCGTCRKAGGEGCENGDGGNVGEDAPPSKGLDEDGASCAGGAPIAPKGGCAGA